jgi:hypothetical protein
MARDASACDAVRHFGLGMRQAYYLQGYLRLRTLGVP